MSAANILYWSLPLENGRPGVPPHEFQCKMRFAEGLSGRMYCVMHAGLHTFGAINMPPAARPQALQIHMRTLLMGVRHKVCVAILEMHVLVNDKVSERTC